MNSELLGEEGKAEYTPEEAALAMRIRVLIHMRWLAVLGIIIATVIASKIFLVNFSPLPVYITCAFIVLYNLVLLRRVRSLKSAKGSMVIQKVRTFGYIHIILDLVALTVILHFTGGIENPFIFYFVFHIILASIVLNYKTVYLLATSAILMLMLLVVLEYTGVINHVNLEGFASPTLYQEISYIVAVMASLATILYGSAYMSTAISGELRKRQRQVVQLREHLLQEKMRELDQSSKEVAKLEEEKNKFLRFLSIAAHDLKAPLVAIQGYLWVILGGFSGEFNERQKSMLERSTYRITELMTLISDLLDIPRIETGQIVQEVREISLRQVIKSSLNDFRALAKEKGIKLKVELPETLPKIRGSSIRLQQVIINLVHNAISYTSEGAVSIKVTEGSNDIEVDVMDTGIGIPSEDLPRLFEDFFRASNVETKGTGLGLSIARRIVEAHGGKIWVECPCPETNCGSKFAFTLPKKNEGRQQQ